MRLNIRHKLLILGLGLTLILVSFAYLLSFNYYKKKVQKRYDESLDLSIELAQNWLKEAFSVREPYSTENDRKDLYNYIIDVYSDNLENDENYPTITDYDLQYEYLQGIYHELYPNKPGTMGMSLVAPRNRSFYSSISADIISSLSIANGVSGEVVYFDQENDRYLMLVNTSFRFEVEEHNGVLPGSYHELTDFDHEVQKEIAEKGYYKYENNIIRFVDFKDSNNQLLARLILYYSDYEVEQSIHEYAVTMILSLLGAGVLLVIFYAILAHFMVVKNINRLTLTSDKFKDDVLNNRELSVIKTNIKTKDEIKKLSNSFETLEEEIIIYTERIQNETAIRLKMKSELEIASHIQMSFLPNKEYVDKNVHISAYIQPAKEVGGDFYDYFYIDNKHLAFIISDVSGKGVPASLFMMRGKELIKAKLLANKKLEDVCYEVNNELLANNEAELFITSFIGVLNIETKELHFVNAGHERPYIINNDGVTQIVSNCNFILGGIEDYHYASQKIVLKDNDRIFLFTDGLNESINENEEEFGYNRIVDSLEQNKVEQDHILLKNMQESLGKFVSNQEAFDDITMLVLSLKAQKLHLCFKNPNYDIITEVTNKFDDYYAFLDKTIISTINIIIDEILNNYVSYENSENHLVDIEVNVDDNKVSLIFRSNGSEYNPLNNEEKYIESYSDELTPGGLGISIVKSMADDVSFNREKEYNVLTVIKNIK